MKTIFTLLLMTLLSTSFADGTRDGTWVGLFQKKPIQNNYSLWTEVQFRYDLDGGAMGQTLIRFGGLKKLDKKNELGAFMGFIQTGEMKEYRPTLHYLYQIGHLGKMNFSSRARLEARFLEDSTDDSLRLRLMLRGQQNIYQGLDLVIWEEPFINLTDDDWTGNRTIERNRFFIGTRFDLSEAHFEVGYMNQFIPRKSDITEHILALFLFY